MGAGQRATHTARQLFAIGEGELAIGRGVRTAFALLIPVIIGDILVQPLYSWAALGGWLGSLADKGGSYRSRATTMGAFAILGFACAYAGTDAAKIVPLAVVSMLIVGLLAGLARVYGDEGSTVGLFIAVIYAVAVGSPSPVRHAPLLRAEMLFAGAAWAMVLSLLLWPLHPFRPARRAVANAYRLLAEFAASLEHVTRVLGDPGSAQLRGTARAHHGDVRGALEAARLVLAGTRRPRQGRSPRGEQLLVLTEGAEQLFGTLVAIDAELEAAHESGSTNADEAFAKAFGSLASTLDLLSNAIDDTVIARKRDARRPAELNEFAVPLNEQNVHLRAAATLLSRMMRDVTVLADTAANIDARASMVVPYTAEHAAVVRPTRDPWAWLRPLREALTSRSLPARHGLRMGIAAALAVWLSFALDITRGYWATITVLIVLQPYTGATMRKTLQRVGGSVLGGIIAAALAIVARTKLAIAGVMVPFTVAAVAVLPLNYGVFVLLLTPVFVLLAEPHPGDWGIAGLRVANTLLGGLVALAAAQLLWPEHELATYAGQLAGLLRELREMLGKATAAANPGAPEWRKSVDESRRRFGVAVTNAEATMQRLITEDSPNPHRVEAAMTITTYGRRMASTLSALAEARARDSSTVAPESASELSSRLVAMVASLDGATPSAIADAAGHVDASRADAMNLSLPDAQIERLRAQLAVMERAVARYQST
ncbi:MAG: FUSC family protein [Gemmatimonadota bacterium]